MEAQEAQRKAEYSREEKEASIVKEESVSLESIYDSETVATMLSIINEYMPSYTTTFTEGDKRQHYIEAGHKLLKKGNLQTAMFAYKKALESGRIEYEDRKTHFDLNFDVEPFLAIGSVFETDEQYDKAMAFYNEAIKQKQKNNFRIPESTTVMSENQLNYYSKSLAKAYFYKALLLKQLREINEAFQNLDEAIKYNKFLCVAYWEKANLFKEAKQFDKAIIVYDELMIHKGGMYDSSKLVTETFYYKAQLLKMMGKNEEAIVEFDKFIASNQEYFNPNEISLQEAYWEKAEALDNLNKTDEANYCKGLALYHSEETSDHKKSIAFFDEALKDAREANNIALYNFYKGCTL
ncbi:tetratricopeptide repeat protein [Rickettsia endosymbiont of Pantilius tunicatus]|uniref:tetratricopeptide repeat protein n=1 Tax=Rickettsia endosymbiont of Pantilius tunicatus TaxID=3066267 RepID=UPI00376F0A99